MHIFEALDGEGESPTRRGPQRRYFKDEGEGVWDAPWRSGPDRIMPCTDAGSAPQEPWHGNTLKVAFAGVKGKHFYELASVPAKHIVQPRLHKLSRYAPKKHVRTGPASDSP